MCRHLDNVYCIIICNTVRASMCKLGMLYIISCANVYVCIMIMVNQLCVCASEYIRERGEREREREREGGREGRRVLLHKDLLINCVCIETLKHCGWALQFDMKTVLILKLLIKRKTNIYHIYI